MSNGSGTASGSYAGISGSGTATLDRGTVVVSNVQDLGNNTARGTVEVDEVWSVTLNTPFGTFTETEYIEWWSTDVIERRSGNVFVHEWSEYGDSGSITFTMTSATTAQIVERGSMYDSYGSMNYEVRYTLSK